MLILIAAVAMLGTQDAYSTHISMPVITTGERSEYSFDQDLIIAGWVKYDGNATPDVLLNIKVLDPTGSLISENFLTSDSAGKFEFLFELQENSLEGSYLVDITSMCWEVHRQICTHKNTQVTVNVEGPNADIHIPQWLKTVAKFWVNDQIDDSGFIQVVEFLIQKGLISIPYMEESPAREPPAMPDWIKTNAGFWVAGHISDGEFADGIKWLVDNGIIRI